MIVTTYTRWIDAEGEPIGEGFHTESEYQTVAEVVDALKGDGLTEFSSSQFHVHGWWSNPDGARVDDYATDEQIEETAVVTATPTQQARIYRALTRKE